jgi:hypothetical protein
MNPQAVAEHLSHGLDLTIPESLIAYPGNADTAAWNSSLRSTPSTRFIGADEDAIRIANGTRYSLAAGVWTGDINRVHRFARRLKAGTVWVDTFGPTDIRLPWGGSRDSGFGRESGEAAIENFTEPKAVWINTSV